MRNSIKSKIGLSISKGDWKGAQWTICGYPNSEVIGNHYSSAYDFEDMIKRNINYKGIDFDCESCCFYAYAKTEKRLIKFLNDIENHFEKAKSMY
jgi:hypothetical protein